jgi:Ferritin-like domain
MQFFQLHELFDTLADSVEEYVDLIAERATSLGGTACGTVRSSAAASRLPEYPLDARNGRLHVEALVAGSRSWLQVHAPPLRRQTRWETPILWTSSQRFHEVWTSTYGSWSRTSRISAPRYAVSTFLEKPACQIR